MRKYECIVSNDMGHLTVYCKTQKLPNDLEKFIYDKITNKINFATDKTGLGARYYILKSGLENIWTYMYKNNIITINYEIDEYNSCKMIYL